MTNDSKQATGSGRVIKAGHVCEMPASQLPGAVFRCDCRRYWRLEEPLGKPRWMPKSVFEAVWRGWDKLGVDPE
jgi:hypothetical protein